MFGMMIREEEKKEVEYLLKREMDEIILDMEDERIDGIVKRAMQERYKILLALLKRVGSQSDVMKYIVIPKGIQQKINKVKKKAKNMKETIDDTY
ncbi:hypothetical protein [Bacillus sp. 2205SS5-2]|uniref:hypothetical protein n=1 Tax=Bacillus sp. 2205SS5-2 TaxID=3109031 RepID=UPI00300482E4